MSTLIAFIGVGNMGCPMAENLMKAGQNVKVFDVSKKMLEIAKDKNLNIAENLGDLISGDVLILGASSVLPLIIIRGTIAQRAKNNIQNR